MPLLRLLALLLVPLLASAQSGGWRNKDGRPVPNSDSMKTQAEFAGSLLVTTDEDWKEKWETPPESTPRFNRAEEVPIGKRVFALLFFSNPQPGADGQVRLSCDLKVSSPTGKVTFQQNAMSCFAGKISGALTNTYLCAPVLAFSGDPGDPVGTWIVEGNIRDEIRTVELPLSYKFKLRR